MTRTVPRDQLNLSIPVIALLKGVLYRDTNEIAWQHLQGLIAQVGDYVATIGLDVVVDVNEGYAFLRSLPDEELAELGISRLIPRHRLSKNTSVMLALLRKRLIEFDSTDSTDSGSRLILGIEQIRRMMQPFMPTGDNEAQTTDKIDTILAKVVELGFVRRIPKQDDQFEVRRVISAFVSADWLADFDNDLIQYVDHGGSNHTAQTQKHGSSSVVDSAELSLEESS
ncbi:DUF4194 domain-containing protein [Rhodococcus sp. (in: high G+C Gram-positive bacteria)]|uniref:DUF4194 domain-containing protein n=1 Tax=Rhodococcus sp. TaxID=1831 RepID=UPI00257FE6CE|nr:DUF4194 domain-containing protein [Rhodococcus sp. (in: high G+C Gram-positive bacteria)]MBQ7803051.1 DUF4194 domain-containing protein [Rhodococcus sp. (in: high G+C Gram-positive bacteria)]